MIRDIASIEICETRCIDDMGCKGLQFRYNKCILLYYSPENFMESANNSEFYCGVVIETLHVSDIPSSVPSNNPTSKSTESSSEFPTKSPLETLLPTTIGTGNPSVIPTDSPTISTTLVPSDSPTNYLNTKRTINMYKKFSCGEIDWITPGYAIMKTDITSVDNCELACIKDISCKGLSFRGGKCIILRYNPTAFMEQVSSPAFYCGVVIKIRLFTDKPSLAPTYHPTSTPTTVPTSELSDLPTKNPSFVPTKLPNNTPTILPTNFPTKSPTTSPTNIPTTSPTNLPTNIPTTSPTNTPTTTPTHLPTLTGIAVIVMKKRQTCGDLNWSLGVQRRKQIKNPFVCKNACLKSVDCQAMQYTKQTGCILIFYKIQKKNMLKVESDQSFCGIVQLIRTQNPTLTPTSSPTTYPTLTPTSSPTTYPTESPVYEKIFIKQPYTKCDGEFKWEQASQLNDISEDYCEQICRESNFCKSYYYTSLGKTCVTMNYRVRTIVKTNKESDPYSICAKVEKPVSRKPTSLPTHSPSESPTLPICNLELKLAHPFESAKESPYYGYHADMLSISNGKEECDIYYPDSEWCNFRVSNNGDSAFLWHIPYYNYFYLDKVTVDLKDTANKSFTINVQHWYSPTEESWTDDEVSHKYKAHLLSPNLTIRNKTNKENEIVKSESGDVDWAHPVSDDIKPYQKMGNKYVMNPEYEGFLSVDVSCSESCFCEVVDPTIEPTLSPVENSCNLEVNLGHPFDAAVESPYYGYHADMLSISNGEEECNYENNTDWCNHSVTNGGDSTFFWHIPYYNIYTLDKEKIDVRFAAEKSFTINVEHWYSPSEEAYTDDEISYKYKAHLLSPILTIRNKSNKVNEIVKDQYGDMEWSHPVTESVKPYIRLNGKWVKNPDYEGFLTIELSCTASCFCEVLHPTFEPTHSPTVTSKNYRTRESAHCQNPDTDDGSFNDDDVALFGGKTVNWCRSRCDKIAKCKGFQYTSDDSVCLIIKKRLSLSPESTSSSNSLCAKVEENSI